MTGTLLFFLVLFFSSAKTESSIKSLSEPCGTSLITFWLIDFGNGKLAQTQKTNSDEKFCEPSYSDEDMTNAQAVFLDSSKNTLWTRKIHVPVEYTYDISRNKKRSGGKKSLTKSEFQIRIPLNIATKKVHWLKIQMDNSKRTYGPAPL